VAEVAVLGVPDRQWGEIGVAVVVCRPGQAVTGEQLIAFLDGKLARYRWPRQVYFWDTLPKSGYGKITKKDVRALLFERGDVLPIAAD
jgi:acyl-CoA synthetase (AMP-forming)/AMP-acid ligase II